MWRIRGCAALSLIALAACTASSTAGDAPSSAISSSTAARIPGCPTDIDSVEALFGETVTKSEGAANGSSDQLCAFSTDVADVGALSVTYLRFPRPALAVTSLAEARQKYGSALQGHTIVSMPSWGTDAFLDETVLPDQDLVAEFAWVPGFEIILGMHADDRHVATRRTLIERLVAATTDGGRTTPR